VITHPMITRSIERAQKRVESQNFAIRKHLLEYDDVMNRQREVIYERRRRVLFMEDMEDLVYEMMDEWIESLFDRVAEEGTGIEAWNLDDMQRALGSVLRVIVDFESGDLPTVSRDEMMEKIADLARVSYQKRKEEIDADLLPNFLQGTILAFIDEEWKDHLYEMDRLKEGVGLRAYGQKDPLVEFKREGYSLFEEMLDRTNEKALRNIFQSRILTATRPKETIAPEQMAAVHRQAAGIAYAYAQKGPSQESEGIASAGPVAQAEAPGKPQPIRKGKAPGRNEPCPCGSGKKYKHCHGK
jgi:preprotein translocase subunit SecA